ncbi:hypothetical protein GCM10027037_15570 [Mucilaginibacter koreensis]
MDLAVYIGELLRKQGKLSVPGLGFFSQVRKDGYYRDDRSIFHPPHYETSFEAQASDDTTLATYLSERKKISVASATYFVEKYINNLKQQAAEADIALDQLGWMRMQGDKLSFKPNAASSTYEQEYFGLPALSVNKIWDQLSGSQTTPQVIEEAVVAEATPISAAPAGTFTPAAPVAEPTPAPTPELAIFPEVLTLRENKAEPAATPVKPKRVPENTKEAAPIKAEATEVAEPKTAINIWILVLIIVTVAAIILLALYQYKPGLFSHRAAPQQVAVKHDNADTIATEKKIDTLQAGQNERSDTSAVVAATTPAVTKTADTTVAVTRPVAVPDNQAATTPAETLTPQQRYDIMGGAFANEKIAKQAITAYKKVGVTARIYESLPGRKVKLTLGTYPSYDEASMHLHQLQAAGKATKDAYVQRPK